MSSSPTWLPYVVTCTRTPNSPSRRYAPYLLKTWGTYLGTPSLRINKPSERARASGKMGILFLQISCNTCRGETDQREEDHHAHRQRRTTPSGRDYESVETVFLLYQSPGSLPAHHE